jgi:hypothetical protein
MPRKLETVKAVKPLTEEELEQISVVFHQFETGVRSGAIRSQVLPPVLRIHRIHVFLGLLDPDPDPWLRIRILLSIRKISKKNHDFYCFVTFF